MKKTFSEIWEGAGPIGRPAIVLFTIAILVMVYLGIKKLAEPKTETEKSVDTAANELDELKQKGVKLSYTESQFRTFADSLESALHGMGSDEDTVERIFQYMQNKADVLQLIKSFGARDYKDDKFFLWNIKQMNLNEWLAQELDQEDRDEYINDSLKKKGIDYRF